MPGEPTPKSAAAFRTIGEVSATTGVPQHVLRYWESRFTQLRPVTRAGNRRYYRPEDVALVERIRTLLEREGYTIRGVQQLLKSKEVASVPVAEAPAATASVALDEIRRVRDLLATVLAED